MKEERVSVAEAIVAYTRNGAYLTFEEDIKGTLEPGKLADLIVLWDDLLTIRPEEILDVLVDLTAVGGKYRLRETARRDTPVSRHGFGVSPSSVPPPTKPVRLPRRTPDKMRTPVPSANAVRLVLSCRRVTRTIPPRPISIR